MRDYRLWWALFVFFGVLSVLVVQRRYRRWQRARSALAELVEPQRAEHMRRLQLEGWRIVLMTASLLTMTGLVFAVLMRAPPPLIFALRVLAITAVLGVVLLGLKL